MTAPRTMRAVVQDRYGGTEVLRLDDIPVPVPGDGEVLVAMRAAGVDAGVHHLVTGRPYAMRLMGFGLRAPKVRVRGGEGAGVVTAVGRGVTRFAAGDRVHGAFDGAFAEYARTNADQLAHTPERLTFEQAAALPISGVTALQALAGVRAGQRVLVVGAGGGVGTYAVQLAKALGGQVTGVCSTGKTELVRGLGADAVLDYTREPLTGRYDLILDLAGNRPLAQLRALLDPDGALVIVGGETDGLLLGGATRLLRAALLNPFTRQRLTGLLSTMKRDDLHRLTELAATGQVTPAVGRTYPLSRAADAIAYQAEHHAHGKIVLTIP
ncbi:NAD(P)-dependent alcohol dehydrogenase [Catellatospora sp. NPDC049609]|uniref:NAD(P)-dependent alcohol dehydrogenase n=1 Tax=Catellatospora sp. NPDC049609 TaxID=3155505 RepID=UPI003424623C